MTSNQRFFPRSSPLMPFCLLITKLFLILLYYVCGMYKSNFNFGAGCPNWAIWADFRFGFVHSTDIVQQNQNIFCNWDTQMHQIWGPEVNWFLARHLNLYGFSWENVMNKCRIYENEWFNVSFCVLILEICSVFFLYSGLYAYSTSSKSVASSL